MLMRRGLDGTLAVLRFPNLCLALHRFFVGIFGRFAGHGLEVFHRCRNAPIMNSGNRLTFLRVEIAEYHWLGAYSLLFESADFFSHLVIFSVLGLHLVQIRVVR